MRRALIGAAGTLQLGDWKMGADTATNEYGTSLLSPAIAIPTRDKVFTLPDDHMQRLHESVDRTDRLLVIGWAGADRHFLDLLVEHRTQRRPTMIIAGGLDAAHRVENAFSDVGLGGTTRIYDYGFSTLLDWARAVLIDFLGPNT